VVPVLIVTAQTLVRRALGEVTADSRAGIRRHTGNSCGWWSRWPGWILVTELSPIWSRKGRVCLDERRTRVLGRVMTGVVVPNADMLHAGDSRKRKLRRHPMFAPSADIFDRNESYVMY